MKQSKQTLRKLAVIPCFNEAGAIGNLLTQIRTVAPDWDTVVIDDGSSDDSAMIARRLSPVVRLPVNVGIGCAVQTGLRYAYQNDYDLAVQIDGDGQHPPEELQHLVERYQQAPANIIIGSRFIQFQGFQSTALRRTGIQVIRTLIRILTGRSVSDPTSGFRLLDRKAIAVFQRDYPHDYPEPVSLALAHQYGLSVGEVPVVMKDRDSGVSSIGGYKSFSYMVRVCVNLCFVRLRRVFTA